MKKSIITISFLILVTLFASPVSALAETKAGIKPGSFFYFFDTTFEKINLFFTFNPEKKAQKAMEYAEEKLAEAEAMASENKPGAVATAMTNYQDDVSLATNESKTIEDKTKAENLLASIADNTSKHQEVLTEVLNKVPDEAKDAITKAIEVSRKGQEEALKQIADLKGEVEQLKKEVAELKTQNEEQEKTIEEVNKQKPETKPKSTPTSTSIKPTTSQTSETTTTPKPATTSSQTQTQTNETQNTQPVIQPSANTTNTTPTPTIQIQTLTTIEISSVNITPSLISARIEWQTNIPTNSKIFLSGGNLSSKIYNSESGLSTRHIVNATGLTSGTTYSYEIESIAGEQVVKKVGSFSTKPDEYTISIQPDKTSVPASGWHNVNFKISALKNGQYQAQQNVSVATPDFTQNRTISTNGISSTGANDWSGSFGYIPKTVGTHTLIFSWNGINKNVDIQATEYVEQKPTAQLSSSPTSIECSQTNISVATVEITNLEENMTLDSVNPFSYNIISNDFTKAELEITPNISNNILSKGGNGYIYFRIKKTPSKTGKFKLEITNTNIKLIGQQSGLYRTINNFSSITPEIEIYDQKLVEWYAYNYNQTIKGYSSPNQNENSLVIINRSQTIATVSSIEWEKQTTGNLQIQNISIYPSLPHNVENYNERNDLLIKITYSGTPQTGDKISIKPTITLSTGQRLECTGNCWLTWSQ